MLQLLILNAGVDDRLHVDWKMLHQTLLRYFDSVEQYALSESFCPLSGVPVLCSDALSSLRQRYARGMRMGTQDVEDLERIHNWTETLSMMAVLAIEQHHEEIHRQMR